MRRRIPLCLFVLLAFLWAAPAPAQLLAAKDGPIVYGHHHLNSSNLEASRKFWVDTLGGTLGMIGTNNVEVIKIPNALIFMRNQKPTGPTKGTTLDHVGFSVPNLRATLDRMKANGYKIITADEAAPNVVVKDDIGVVAGSPITGIAYVLAPDDVKVEVLEVKSQTVPVLSHHLHFNGPQKEMQAWYMKVFGAAERPAGNPTAFVSAGLPGLTMNFTPQAKAMAGTAGRALDHIGFEVKNLEAFTKNLEAQGLKLNVPYRQVPALGIAIAFITDPWGTYIELTEGLDKIK
jgi:catechol 2,3-dioxygenase-like lactoylglutathione lyase family enzyme